MIRHGCADARELEQHLADWLASEPAACALVTFAAGKAGAWSTVFDDEDGPQLAIAQTPGWPPVLAAADPARPRPPSAEAVALVVAELQREGRCVPGVNGPAVWVDALVAQLGRTVTDRRELRLHRLHGAPQLPRPVSGELRAAREADFPILREWIQAFEEEAVPEATPRPPDDETLHRILPDTWLRWADGEPRSMLRRGRPCQGGWTISGVYTPPDQRGRGYAGAAVHDLSQRLLDEGARYVALFTDLANPTSNALYARIGFRALCDQVQVLWEGDGDG